MVDSKNDEIIEFSDPESSNDSFKSNLIHLNGSTEAIGDNINFKTSFDCNRSKIYGPGRRRPTRRPDPNTSNRNALMARENRRKKKEYIETLESEVNSYRTTNKKLKKLLKSQMKLVQSLKEDKKYYQSILANKTEIVSLVKAIRGVSPSILLSDGKGYSPQSETASLYTDEYDGNKDKSVLTDPFIDDNFSYADFGTNITDEFESWENLLGSASPLSDSFIDNLDLNKLERQSQVSDEHNYNTRNDGDSSDAGVCLHVSGGKISLEFCPACHKSSRES